jgi:hypothetical protein
MEKFDVETFKYQTLTNPDSIRLLIIHPARPSLVIHCSLEYTTLSDCYGDIYDQYTALSYVWGDPNNQRTIFLDDQPFNITANLAAALEDLRHQYKTLRLWVDAICINQSDLLERNHQVTLMRDIYAFAHQTVVYLRTSTVEGDTAFETLEYCKSPDRSAFDYGRLQAVATYVLSSPWFTRVWVYQELVLSKMVWVQLGRKRLQWEAFCTSLDTYTRSSEFALAEGSKSRHIDSLVAIVSRMKDARYAFQHSLINAVASPQSLFEVLLARRGCGAADSRDLVFGNLAVAGLNNYGTPDEPKPIVDYKTSVVQVFTEATLHILSTNWEVLYHVDVLDNSRRLEGLPSWVPDWSLDSSCYPLPFRPDTLQYFSSSILELMRSQPAPVEEHSALGFHAYWVGTLQGTSCVIQYSGENPMVTELYNRAKPNDIRFRTKVYREVYKQWQHRLGMIGDFFLPPLAEDFEVPYSTRTFAAIMRGLEALFPAAIPSPSVTPPNSVRIWSS